MRYLNEDQSQQLNGLLRRYTDDQESITVRAGRTIVYRGTPGETPEIDRITPQQLKNLSNAIDNPSQSTGTIKISKEETYQVQAGQRAEYNTLQPLDRSFQPAKQASEMAEMQAQVAELKQQNATQSDRIALWEKEMAEMREVISRQERLLKQATTPIHERLDNWFDQQKGRIGNWLEQQKERISNRIEDFRSNVREIKDNIQERFSDAKQQVLTNIDDFRGNVQERVADARQQVRATINEVTGVADLQKEVRQLQEKLRAQELADRATGRTELRQEVQRLQEEVQRLQEAQRRRAIEVQQQQRSEAQQRQKQSSNRVLAKEQPSKSIEYARQRQPEEIAKLSERDRAEFEQLASQGKREKQELNKESDYSPQKDPYVFRYTKRASDEEQIKMGIIPPVNITQAGAETHARYVAELRMMKAESIASAQAERLREAGIAVEPKKYEAIRKEAFDKVEAEWRQSKAEALKSWQESKGQKENHQPQNEEQVKVRLGDLQQWRQEAQALGRSEKYLEKIDHLIHSAREKTHNPANSVKVSERAFKIMQRDRQEAAQQAQQQASVRVHISELKQWRQEAQALGHSEKYLNKIDQINELAKQKASPDGFVTLKDQDWKKMQVDRQQFREQSQSEVHSQSWGMRR